jgi:hypothetical protein
LIKERIEGCVRCYRYSGSFMGYLFKPLEYAGKGLRLITEYALDEPLYYGREKESIKLHKILKLKKCRYNGRVSTGVLLPPTNQCDIKRRKGLRPKG